MPQIKYIMPKNKHTTSTGLQSRIQFIQNEFKLIEFNHDIKRQTDEPVNKKNTIAYMTDILINYNKNCFSFQNNIEYT